MANKINRLKGTNDILPGEVEQWQALEQVIRDTMRCFNFNEIRPPVFEITELFARGVGESTDIVSKEMYTFSDMGGNSLTLRPELTASVVRAYIQNNLQQVSPVQKLWYEGPMFRQERPQKGRYRQFWQFGVEAIGSPNPEQDVEVIALFQSILEELGIAKGVVLNINTLGDSETRTRHREALREFLEPHLQNLSATSRQRFDSNPLRILDSKDPDDQALVKDAPAIREFLNPESESHYEQVLGMLTEMGIAHVQNDRLVRGLDYYTHTTFEFTCDALGAQDAICGGGRYDDLINQLGGGNVPAIGWASGIERLLLVVDALNAQDQASKLDLFLVVASESLRSQSLKLINQWRTAGLSCDTDTMRRSLKAQMREANRKGARFVAIFGEEEFLAGKIQLKNLENGEQEAIALADVVPSIKTAV
jgi:histidyl-tRNA synthetase